MTTCPVLDAVVTLRRSLYRWPLRELVLIFVCYRLRQRIFLGLFLAFFFVSGFVNRHIGIHLAYSDTLTDQWPCVPRSDVKKMPSVKSTVVVWANSKAGSSSFFTNYMEKLCEIWPVNIAAGHWHELWLNCIFLVLVVATRVGRVQSFSFFFGLLFFNLNLVPQALVTDWPECNKPE